MTDDPSFNPYAPPESEPKPPVVTRLPGWLVTVFGFLSLILWGDVGPSLFGDEFDSLMDPHARSINALFYGVPSAIAALVFGVGNLSAKKQQVTSALGILLGIAGLVGGVLQLRAM